jgi:colanic acid biosynthesis glycosyl transferase WcaI
MRILLLTDNYPPESNAPAVRASAHAKRWSELGHETSVVTCFPNFPEGKLYEGHRQSFRKRQMIDGVDVTRVPTLIFPNAGTFKRTIDFVSYMVSGSIASLFLPRPDVVVATSPQFFTAVAGWLVSALRRRPFVFELRDLWPDSIVAVGALGDGILLKLLRRMEFFLYRRADLIVTVTHAFRTHLIERGIDSEKIEVVRNGADVAVLSPGDASELRARLGLEGKIIVSYIGTIGMSHGLDIVLNVAADLAERQPQITFMFVGSGAERDGLRKSALDLNLANVLFVDRVPHAEIVDYWRVSDMTLVLLKDSALFKTVIPSKIFEALAAGTPIVTNVRGEAESLLAPLGAAVRVAPANEGELSAAITSLAADAARRHALSKAGRAAALGFTRQAQADLMLGYLTMLASKQ